MRLFGRASRLVVGVAGQGLDVSNLDMKFSIKKDLKPIPNTGTIEVYGLNRSHQQLLETADVLNVEFYAGYVEAMGLIYLGEMRSAVTTRTGSDVTATLSLGDKHGNFAGKRIRQSLGKGATVGNALELLADAFGLGKKGLENVLKTQKAGKTLTNVGGALTGNVAQLMTSICRGAGLEWSVQDGVLQVIELDKAQGAEETAIVLGPNTGMVGNVSMSNKGYMKVRSLLIPGLQPGGKIVFSDEVSIKGGYRIEKIHYHGGTADNEWYADMEAKLYTKQ